jgi:CrcB protein
MAKTPGFGAFDPGRAMEEMARPIILDPEVESPTTRGLPASHLLLVLLGGALGTLGRYLLLERFPAGVSGMPIGLLVVNSSGSLVLGLLGALLFERRRSAVGTRVFLASGVLGGWTTYSGIVSSFLLLGHEQHLSWALATLATAFTTNILAAVLGIWVGSLIARRLDAGARG